MIEKLRPMLIGLLVVFGQAAYAQDADRPAEAVVPPQSNAKVKDWQSEVARPGSNGVELDANQTKLVKKVSDYFLSIQSLKGSFVQTDAGNKRMKGKFFVQRPGRFRFDYALPSKQVIVSDGEYLAIQDLDLNNEDRIALDQTPFRLLLRKDVDLLRDAKIMEVQQAEDLIVIAIEDKDPNSPGRIKLFLSTKPALELKEWVTTDPQGLDTRVELTQVTKPDELDANLFKIQMLGAHRTSPN